MRHTHAHNLAVAFSAAFAAFAGASPMIFTNPAPGEPGHFDWTPPTPPPFGGAGQLLDITQPSTVQYGVNEVVDQIDTIGAFNLGIQVFFDPFEFPNTTVFVTLDPGFGGLIYTEGPGPGLLDLGDTIGPGGVIPNPGGGGGLWSDYFHDGQFIDSNISVPLGDHFLGVSFFELDEQNNIIGDHFGFIGINVFENPDGSHDLFATSWGYETELNTPITIIPAPGAMPLIALAGLSASHRKRG